MISYLHSEGIDLAEADGHRHDLALHLGQRDQGLDFREPLVRNSLWPSAAYKNNTFFPLMETLGIFINIYTYSCIELKSDAY